MFVARVGFHLTRNGRSCQLQDRIARNNPVLHAKGGSWPPTVVPDGPPVPRQHCITGDLCAFSGLVSFGDAKP